MKKLLPGEPWFHPDMACLEVEPDLFFSTNQEGIESAKSICRSCPLMVLCAQRALAAGEEHGVWGALTPEERRKMLAQQDHDGAGGARPRRAARTARVGSAA